MYGNDGANEKEKDKKTSWKREWYYGVELVENGKSEQKENFTSRNSWRCMPMDSWSESPLSGYTARYNDPRKFSLFVE